MNAQTKVVADENTAIWQAVSKTDPAHTKKVNQRGGFTAISAHYQVMRATEQFGPVGIGWGYSNGEPIWHDALVIVPVTLWHGNRENTFGPVYGGAEWKSGTRLDSDAVKKAATDGLTKALSHLGFNADVFLGRFDDNKYVAQVTAEFAEGQGQGDSQGKVSPPQPNAPPKTHLDAAEKRMFREIESCGDADMLDAYLGTPEAKADYKMLNSFRPDAIHGPAPEGVDGFVSIADRIKAKRDEFALAVANHMADLART